MSAGSPSVPASDTESCSDNDSPRHEPSAEANEVNNQTSNGDLEENKGRSGTKYESPGYKGGLVLVTVSGGGDFDAIKKWSDGVVKVHPSDLPFCSL